MAPTTGFAQASAQRTSLRVGAPPVVLGSLALGLVAIVLLVLCSHGESCAQRATPHSVRCPIRQMRGLAPTRIVCG